MQERKFIFFDIDGTLTDDNPGGKVLPSTLETLQKLRDNGHFVALATGRGHHFAHPFMKEHGFDNMVSDGGNGITINKKLLGIEPLDHELALQLIHELIEKKIPFSVALDNTPTVYTLKGLEFINHLGKQVAVLNDFDHVEEIHKIFIKATVEQEKDLEMIHKLGYMRYHGTDLIVEPLEKFRGIKKVVEYMEGDLKDVVVFGDGKNDISMMQQAAMSIAMGNALPEVKEIASYITKTNKEDGIMFACKHFGWID
ncbi:MAG: HAD-IIB family hydrolase [Coprobacillaceae bacterium]